MERTVPDTAGSKVGRAADKAQDAGQRADGPQLRNAGRAGVAASGVMYLLLAYLAVQVAFGDSDKSADNTGAFKELAEKPGGDVLLWVLVLAFLAFAVWQGVLAAVGFRTAEGASRIAKRVQAGAKAVFAAGLAWTCARVVLGGPTKDSSEQEQDITAKLLDHGWGRALVVLAGLAVVALAAYLVVKGVRRTFLDNIEGTLPDWQEWLGVAGYVARGVAFGIVGVLLVVAGVRKSSGPARGLDAALNTLADQPAGPWLLLAVALGLAAFGVYQLLTFPRYREA